jgi:hypothetical protein
MNMSWIQSAKRFCVLVMWPWGLLACVVVIAVADKKSALSDVAVGIILAVLGFLFLKQIVAPVMRVACSLIGLGKWCCSRRWHWWQDFPVHTHYGLGTRTKTYLAVDGRVVRQCGDCALYDPPEGEDVRIAFDLGLIHKIGGSRWSAPAMRGSGPYDLMYTRLLEEEKKRRNTSK